MSMNLTIEQVERFPTLDNAQVGDRVRVSVEAIVAELTIELIDATDAAGYNALPGSKTIQLHIVKVTAE